MGRTVSLPSTIVEVSESIRESPNSSADAPNKHPPEVTGAEEPSTSAVAALLKSTDLDQLDTVVIARPLDTPDEFDATGSV